MYKPVLLLWAQVSGSPTLDHLPAALYGGPGAVAHKDERWKLQGLCGLNSVTYTLSLSLHSTGESK